MVDAIVTVFNDMDKDPENLGREIFLADMDKLAKKAICTWVSDDYKGHFTVGKEYDFLGYQHSGNVRDGFVYLKTDLDNNFKVHITRGDIALFEWIHDKQESIDKGQKYQREIKSGVFVDIYDVLRAWNVTCPASQHAIKKLLAAGQRGHKSKLKDLQEAANSANRAVKLHEEWPDA